MSKADDIFWKEFGVILVLLTLFGFAMFFLARAIAGTAFEETQLHPKAVAARIAPIGDVRVGDPSAQAAAPEKPEPDSAGVQTASAAASPSGQSGEQIYQTVCLACHTTGVANAPKIGEAAAWEPRMTDGLDALVQSAIDGKGAMPPRGGLPSLTDEDVRAAVVHILEDSGIDTGG